MTALCLIVMSQVTDTRPVDDGQVNDAQPAVDGKVREATAADKADIIQILHLFAIWTKVKSLDTPEQLREGLIRLQRITHIPQTGVVDEATIEVLGRRRCGQEETEDMDLRRRKKRFAINSKFDRDTVEWNLVNQTMSEHDAGQVRRIMTKAFDLWTRNTGLTVKEAFTHDPAQIQVAFYKGDHKDGYPFDGAGRVLAHAFYPGHDMHGLHFDNDENWVFIDDPETYFVKFGFTAAHEIGHALGLFHSSDGNSLMSPFYKSDRLNLFNFDKLPEDDQLAIYSIYGQKEPEWGPYDKSINYPDTQE